MKSRQIINVEVLTKFGCWIIMTLAVVPGLSGTQSEQFQSKNGSIPFAKNNVFEYEYHIMWKVAKHQDEVLHMVWFPRHATVGFGSTTGLGTKHIKSTHHEDWDSNIYSSPDHLYLGENTIPVKQGQRIFVWTQQKELVPIPVPDNELAPLLPNKIGTFEKSDLWTKTIRPVLDKEEWTLPGQ